MKRKIHKGDVMKKEAMLIPISIFVICFFAQSSQAFAECKSQGKNKYSIPKGFGFNSYSISDGGNCGFGYKSGGGTALTKASIKSPPSNGNLKQDKNFHFIYSPAKSFSGEDKFTINLCGSYQGKENCVDNNYTVKVQRK
jgi:hypothetical protein